MTAILFRLQHVINPRLTLQNSPHSADNIDIFKYIFMNEKSCILIRIPLKFVPKGQIDNKSALVQVMAWHRRGNKSGPMLTLFIDTCVYAALREYGAMPSCSVQRHKMLLYNITKARFLLSHCMMSKA